MITRGGIRQRNISEVQKEPGVRARRGYERNEVVRNFENSLKNIKVSLAGRKGRRRKE